MAQIKTITLNGTKFDLNPSEEACRTRVMYCTVIGESSNMIDALAAELTGIRVGDVFIIAPNTESDRHIKFIRLSGDGTTYFPTIYFDEAVFTAKNSMLAFSIEYSPGDDGSTGPITTYHGMLLTPEQPISTDVVETYFA